MRHVRDAWGGESARIKSSIAVTRRGLRRAHWERAYHDEELEEDVDNEDDVDGAIDDEPRVDDEGRIVWSTVGTAPRAEKGNLAQEHTSGVCGHMRVARTRGGVGKRGTGS